MSTVRGAMKRRQVELDIQRVLDEEFVSAKRQKLYPGLITSNNVENSTSGSATQPLSPIPQAQRQQIGSDEVKKSITSDSKSTSIGPYRLTTALDENSKSCSAVDTRCGDRLVICRRLDRSKYERIVRLAQRLSSGPKTVTLEDEEEDQRAYEQIFPPNSEFLTGDDGNYYYFEPKDYGSLHAYVVERKRLNEHECLRYFRQILRLVLFCHRRRVVLRDLKLRKFVFADAERLTIRLDGLDELFVCPDTPSDDEFDESGDKISDRHGCPAYVGPEILDLSQKSYSGRSADIWSLGVLLYVVLYGRYPFYDTTPARLFTKIRHAPVQLIDDASISFEAKSLIRCLLRKDPIERPSAIEISAHPWLQSGDRARNAAAPPRRQPLNHNGFGRGTDKESNDQCVPCVGVDEKSTKTIANAKSTGRRTINDEPAVPNQ